MAPNWDPEKGGISKFLLFFCVDLARAWGGLGALGVVWGLPGGSLGGGLGALGVVRGVWRGPGGLRLSQVGSISVFHALAQCGDPTRQILPFTVDCASVIKCDLVSSRVCVFIMIIM